MQYPAKAPSADNTKQTLKNAYALLLSGMGTKKISALPWEELKKS
jgi:hypothetical protein